MKSFDTDVGTDPSYSGSISPVVGLQKTPWHSTQPSIQTASLETIPRESLAEEIANLDRYLDAKDAKIEKVPKTARYFPLALDNTASDSTYSVNDYRNPTTAKQCFNSPSYRMYLNLVEDEKATKHAKDHTHDTCKPLKEEKSRVVVQGGDGTVIHSALLTLFTHQLTIFHFRLACYG